MKAGNPRQTRKSRSLDSVVVPDLPTEFRGCQWDEHWEFDAPCAIYYPRRYMRVGDGNNTGKIDSMVEDICIDISLGRTPSDGGLDRECKWRGWSKYVSDLELGRRGWTQEKIDRWAAILCTPNTELTASAREKP